MDDDDDEGFEGQSRWDAVTEDFWQEYGRWSEYAGGLFGDLMEEIRDRLGWGDDDDDMGDGNGGDGEFAY